MTGGQDTKAAPVHVVPHAAMFLPKISPPFAQTGSALTPNVFATAHVNSPWNPTLTGNGAKLSPWMTAQPIEIEVVPEQQAQAPSIQPEKSAKISWSSAEELADALFPSKAEQQQAQHVHEGLLNHKKVLQQLQSKTENLGSSLKEHVHTTATHMMAQERRHKQHAAHTENAIETLKDELKMQTHSNSALQELQKANSRLQQQHEQLRQDFVQQQRAMETHSQTLSLHKDALLQHKNEMMNIKSTQKTHDSLMTTIQANDKYHSAHNQSQSTAISALQRDYHNLLKKDSNMQKTQAQLEDLHARIKKQESQVSEHGAHIERMRNTIQQPKPDDTHVRFASLEAPRSRGR